jgi:hypothetical protein
MGEDLDHFGHDAPSAAPRRMRGVAVMPSVGVLGGDVQWSVLALLRRAGVDVAEVEAGPKQISESLATKFHFGYGSVRAGALGSVRAVLQLVQAAAAGRVAKYGIWTAEDGSFFDAQRPEVDPYGFASKADVTAYRAAHLAALTKLLKGISTLVLPLSFVRALQDVDGTVYPRLMPGAKPPRGAKPALTDYDLETIDADFAALHAILVAFKPGLVLRLVINPQAEGLSALADQAKLRALAAHWAGRFDGVIYDPILDHLLARMAADTDARLGLAVQKLMAGGDILAGVEAPVVAAMEDAEMGIPAPADAPKRDRAARKAARAAKGKNRGGGEAKVMCEDELLEAFS